jgi:hypothetical protein
MVLITIVTGAYNPTYNWGASHCINGGSPSSLVGLLKMENPNLKWMMKMMKWGFPYPILGNTHISYSPLYSLGCFDKSWLRGVYNDV